MPVDFEVDRETGLLVFRASGECHLADFFGAVERAQRTSHYRPGVHILWDLREFEPMVQPDDVIDQMLEFNRKNVPARGDGRSAFVATGDLLFGMLRMFQARADDLPVHFQVFRDYHEALAWLGQGAQGSGGSDG